MPGLPHKLIIFTTNDGVAIQPLAAKAQRPFQPVGIKYGTANITNTPRNAVLEPPKPGSFFDAFGVVGLIRVSGLSYLITIVRRQQVATILGFPVYVVTEVAVTPCSSQSEAEDAIQKTSQSLRSKGTHALTEDTESEDEDDTASVGGQADDVNEALEKDEAGSTHSTNNSSFAEDVMRRRGSYGRFAQSWFSKNGWTLEQRKQLGMSGSPTASPQLSAISLPAQTENLPVEADLDSSQYSSSLLPKLLRTLQILFGTSRSFYFSYDLDLTRSLSKAQQGYEDDSPLHSRVDPTFFWNRHVLGSFLAAGQDSLALPLMQGFIGQHSFSVDKNPNARDASQNDSLEMQDYSVLHGSEPVTSPILSAAEVENQQTPQPTHRLTLISRRSTKRAGLRYLRRGIDEDGNVANMVETEQILSPHEWTKSSPAHSFVQIRGSIPVYFTQSPYSFKPAPVLQHTNETNYQACKLHLERLVKSYDTVQIVNLVEKRGVEETVGKRFQHAVERFTEENTESKTVAFEWFDFHHACRGMKFENVSELLSTLRETLKEMGSTKVDQGQIQRKQLGVIRTNCMDCLDRTNVCQSSFGRHLFEAQLEEEGIDLSTQSDRELMWFNGLWADNGDAISKQYASTAAMKGDFTRTKKRDYRGALNDLGLSLARFYSGMVNDYFSQTAIDFLLGTVTEKIFDEFESDMMSKDPAVSVAKMREQAVDLCRRRVIADESEEFHGGWTLLSPHTSNSIKSWPLEEVIVLLTDTAVYLSRFDWNLDKVSSFERVNLASILSIKIGTYITSTMSHSHVDESRNVGFVVTYRPGKTDVRRTNTRTLSTKETLSMNTGPKGEQEAIKPRPTSWVNFLSGQPKEAPSKIVAFKALYMDSSRSTSGSGPQQTELQLVDSLCAEIERLALDAQVYRAGEEKKSLVEKGEIISLETAKRNTGVLEQLGHSLKRLVWA